MRGFIPSGGGRREIPVVCPSCSHASSVPPSAVARNSFYCSGCGKPLDLSGIFRQLTQGAGSAAPPPRRDRSESRYKSARKGRR